MNACHARLDKLEAELQGVVDASKGKLDKAAEKAPDKPEGWDAVKQKGNDFARRLKDGCRGIWRASSPGRRRFQRRRHATGRHGRRRRLRGRAPQGVRQSRRQLGRMERNPVPRGRAAHPRLLLALASGGTGALRKGASPRRTPPTPRRPRDGRCAGTAAPANARTASPDKHDKCKGEKCKAGRAQWTWPPARCSCPPPTSPCPAPCLSTLKRHYVSGHPCGGWFGPTWAGTLDQRLELDDQGIVYIADDGMLLTYPVPEPDVPTLPTSGPRWPLCWDGKPDGTMTITAPERNRTLALRPAADGRSGAGPRRRSPTAGGQPHHLRLRRAGRAARRSPTPAATA